MNSPLTSFVRALSRVIVPVGIVAALAGTVGGLLEKKAARHRP